ncbi:hypothetical protein NFI96_023142 [Prochilodus magdalenae]|nr:hypothetical protein NFI96_023142 [Prochilodus magdalenae]
MRVSVVLLWFYLSYVQLQKGDDQLAVEEAMQSRLDRLQKESLVEGSDLPNMWAELRQLRDIVVEQKVLLQFSQSQIEELKKENAGRPKVAFTFASGLQGYHGPYSADRKIVFRKQITNVGNAFNHATGDFTAPVRGVYYFRFSVLGSSHKYWTGVHLVKNHQRIIIVHNPPTGDHQYAVGGATLLLEKGDVVYVVLRGNCQMYDSSDNHSSFSGFLVFPM